MELILKDNRLQIADGAFADTLFPETARLSENICTWSVDGVDFTLTFNRNESSIKNIKLIRSVKSGCAEDESVAIEMSGRILHLIGGIWSDGIFPKTVTKTGEDGARTYIFDYENTKISFSAKVSETSVTDMKMEIEGFKPKEHQDGSVSLVPYGDLLVCEGGALTDDVIPNEIITISDTKRHFIYGNKKFSLTWTKTDGIIKDIEFSEI
ncbi:MAG: hypothetical protein NC078_01675 [Ruminococcus sp.]|nr:hypothetical protein [Ruminococcus sp.]